MNLIQTFRRLGQLMSGWQKKGESLYAQMPLISKLYKKNGFELRLTCEACPEQYDVLKRGKQIAYYRLRHGEFRVDVPNCGGVTIYEDEPIGDGCFDDDERIPYLTKALRALQKHLKQQNEN